MNFKKYIGSEKDLLDDIIPRRWTKVHQHNQGEPDQNKYVDI